MFVTTYIKALTFLAARGNTNRLAADRQVAFLNALSAEAKARLDRGEYPPYHLVNAARRAVDVPTHTAKCWLKAFLYWRSNSRQLGSYTGAGPDAAPGTSRGAT